MILFVAVSLAAIVLAVVLALTLWRLRGTIGMLERRVDETLRELELSAEDLRKTNAVVRDVLFYAERSAANVAYMTEGVRGLRSTLDAASSVLRFVAFPVLGNLAAGLAGAKAAVSHVVSKHDREKEGSHE